MLFGKKENGRVKVNEEIGQSGTKIYSGRVVDEDYVPELTGENALLTYDKMRKSDGVIGASLLACELPIRAAKFYIEPASEDQQDQDIADFIEYNLFDGMTITWDDFLREALLMLPFGFQCFEKVFQPFKYKGQTYIGWRKFAPRLPFTIYKWETSDGKDGITQMLPDGTQPSIPIEKLLIFTHRKEGDNWLGTSLLRTSYRSWYIKQNIEKINAIAIERQGIGIPYAVLPPNATPEDEARAEKILQNLRANQKAYLLIPSGWEVGFMDMKGTSIIDPTNTIQRLNREMFYSVLAQFLDLGSQPSGSRALSADQSTIFHNNLHALARQICDVINNYAIKQLVDINWEVKNYPKLKFTKIGKVDLNELSSAIERLVTAGTIIPDKDLEDYLRDAMNLPAKVEKENTPEAPKQSSEKKFAEQWMPKRPLTFAEHKVRWLDVHDTFEKSEKELRKQLEDVLADIKSDLVRQVQRILSSSSPAERRDGMDNLSVSYLPKLRQLVYQYLKNSFEYGKMSAAHEMSINVPSTPSTMISVLGSKADILVEAAKNDLLKEAKLTLINKLEGKKFAEVPLSTILAALGKALDSKISDLLIGIPSVVVSGGINQGRRVAIDNNKDEIYALQRSELLDDKTCDFCASMDGRVFKKDDPITREDGFHINCLVRWNTPIFTSTGWKPIGKIKEGELVLTHRGRFRKVLKTFRVPKQTPNIVRFNFDSYNKDIRWLSVTDEHPIIANGKMIEAKDLKVGDKVRIMADECPVCGKLKPYYRLTCSKKCGSILGAKKCWSKPEYKDKMKKIISQAMKLQYQQGVRNGEEITKQAHLKMKEMAKNGTHPFQRPDNLLKAKKAISQCNYGQSYLEKKMRWLLEKINLDFIQQYPIKKGTDKLGRDRYYFLDFALPNYKLAIECDGEYFHSDENREKQRQEFIEKQGWQFLRFTGEQIRKNLSGCALEIQRVIDNHEGRYNFIEMEVKSIKKYKPKRPLMLYNLTVEDDHTYLANGILVGNCRGLWVEIMKDELEKPEITGIPDGLRNSYKGFNNII